MSERYNLSLNVKVILSKDLKEMSQGAMWILRRTSAGGKKRKCKGTVVSMCLVCSRTVRSVARAW